MMISPPDLRFWLPVAVLPHQFQVVIAVVSSRCWNTEKLVLPLVEMLGVENSIGPISSACNPFCLDCLCDSFPTALCSCAALLENCAENIKSKNNYYAENCFPSLLAGFTLLPIFKVELILFNGHHHIL